MIAVGIILLFFALGWIALLAGDGGMMGVLVGLAIGLTLGILMDR